ncbi:MAG: hypothetical protein K5837_02520 [Candidatus Saccharibacteria bacterium]|nr:hypothetical protein [Candidatus Saccharibacteria bacterium]
MSHAESFSRSEVESSGEDLHKSFVDYLVGVGEEPKWRDEEQLDSVLDELMDSRGARDKLREELAEFTSSPEGSAYVEDSVAKYIGGERDSLSLRQDVLRYLVIDIIDKKWADFLAQKRPDIYRPDEQAVKNGIKQDVVNLLRDPEKPGLDRRIFDALPEGSIDFAHLDIEEVTPVIENFVRVVAEKMGLESVPEVNVTVSNDVRHKVYCHNEGSASTVDNAIKVDINSHTSLSEVANTVTHELWHRRQAMDKDYEGDELAQQLYINNIYYIGSKNDYAAYRSQLVEQQARYVGNQMGAFFRMDYLDRHPEKVAEMAEMYAKIENGEYDPAKVEDGLDAAYYRDARNMLARLQKQE